MRDRAVDGLLIADNRDDDPETLRRLGRIPVPIVLWERDGSGRFDTVVTEHLAGVGAATRHRLDLGHRDLTLVADYEEAFAAAGVSPVAGRIFRVGAFGADDFKALLRSSSPPTGVIANVNEIPTIVRVANPLSLALPKDLSVVSIGDADILEVASPAITAVRGDGSRVDQSAADRLLGRLMDNDPRPDPAVSVNVPMTLVPRRSTGSRPA